MESTTNNESQKNTNRTEREQDRALARSAILGGQLTQAVHQTSVDAVGEFVSEKREMEISEAQKRIEHTAGHETIHALEQAGELEPSVKATSERILARYNISPYLMTPEEAQRLEDWAANKAPDARDEKAEMISEIISETINGKRVRRDGEHSRRFRTLVQIDHKFDEWQRGLIDTSLPFDTAEYGIDPTSNLTPPRGNRRLEYEDFNFERQSQDHYGYSSDEDEEYEQLLIQSYRDGDIDSEELFDALGIDPDDEFVYGPYTKRDLGLLRDLSTKTYTDMPDQRLKTPVGQLVDNTLPIHVDNIEDGLLYRYIGERILPERRLSARDLVTSASALGLKTQEVLSTEEETSPAIKELKKNLSWCSYYIARICRIGLSGYDDESTHSNMLKKSYGKARPITADFFREAIDRSESWTDRQAEEINKMYNSYLVKLEEWLYRTESAYDRISRGEENAEDGEEFEIPDIFGTIDSTEMPQLPPAESN